MRVCETMRSCEDVHLIEQHDDSQIDEGSGRSRHQLGVLTDQLVTARVEDSNDDDPIHNHPEDSHQHAEDLSAPHGLTYDDPNHSY